MFGLSFLHPADSAVLPRVGLFFEMARESARGGDVHGRFLDRILELPLDHNGIRYPVNRRYHCVAGSE